MLTLRIFAVRMFCNPELIYKRKLYSIGKEVLESFLETAKEKYLEEVNGDIPNSYYWDIRVDENAQQE